MVYSCLDTYLWAIVLLPVTNTIVSWRLAYHPTPAIALVEENAPEAEAETGNGNSTRKSPGFFGTAKSIYRTEGPCGLYKGFVPVFLFVFLRFLLSRDLCVPRWEGAPKLVITPGPLTMERTLSQALFTNFWYTLALVWTYRCIAATSKLSIYETNIKDSLVALFSPYELSKKLLPILFTPGLTAAMFINIVCRVFLFRELRNAIFYYITWRLEPWAVPLAAFAQLVVVALSTAISAPLDMAVTRLCVQRNTRRISTWKDLGFESKVAFALVVLLNAITIFLPSVGRAWNRPLRDIIGVTEVLVPHIDVIFIIYASWAACKNRDNRTGDEEHSSTPDQETNTQGSHVAGTGVLPQDDLCSRVGESYNGLYHCMRTIIREEGRKTLYRGWWITALGLFLDV